MIGPQVTVIDYGMGNIWSVLAALRFLNVDARTSSDPAEIVQSRYLILPGVGSFRRAMESLRAGGLDRAIIDAVRGNRSNILGICLGMQLLGSWGSEDGETAGLGLVDCRVDRFTPVDLAGNKSPHIGFNSVKPASGSKIFKGLPEVADFYFVHSYRMVPEGAPGMVSLCNHGVDFVAAIEVENICGVQFHPEKSQTNGLTLLRNFLEV